jgi:hypothetical protein
LIRFEAISKSFDGGGSFALREAELEVESHGRRPADVARAFLAAKHLLPEPAR